MRKSSSIDNFKKRLLLIGKELLISEMQKKKWDHGLHFEV